MNRIGLLLLFGLLISCKEAKEPPELATVSYRFEVPAHFPAPEYDFKNNPVTEAGFTLGRMLFFDPVLSRDSTVSCSSCHQQFVAFAHADHDRSHGIDNQLTQRNSIALFNLPWQKDFFWDGGVGHLEVVPLSPISNPLEMDESMNRVIQKINHGTRYKGLFKKAFGRDTADNQTILWALTQFQGLMISAGSRYDRYRTGREQLSHEELQGLALFTSKCGPCHAGELFTDRSFRNNGLNTTFTTDTGREHITTLSSDRGKFKVPSLRNIALTGPYMHNGKLTSLQKVLDHYSSGVKHSATLDPLLDKGDGTYGISLTEEEKEMIITFLLTLTDPSFITDPKFKDPFAP